MSKIVLIGAGSTKFTCRLVNDILLTPSGADAHIVLVDINAERLAQAGKLVRAIVARNKASARVELATDRKLALPGAHFVINTILVGGMEPYAADIEIPARYGVLQCVGDTLGPGGVFRGLRTIPVVLGICRDMEELCPDALFLNYTNPMAIVCMAIAQASGIRHVGLCHSVQGTSEMLARWIGAPYEEVGYRVAGINHLAWFLSFTWKGADAYPLLRRRLEDPDVVDEEPVRTDLMKHFGYFVTESSAHASEYVPYFRKSETQVDDLVRRFKSPGYYHCEWGRTGGSLHFDRTRLDEFAAAVDKGDNLDELLPAGRSHEYGSRIVEAVETSRPLVINGNVPNRGLITNLPGNACVEVPCLVDGQGFQPTIIGDLPEQLAALDRSNIAVQALAVQGALTADREAIYHALMVDPLTAATCELAQIRAMADELFAADAPWLPQFAR